MTARFKSVMPPYPMGPFAPYIPALDYGFGIPRATEKMWHAWLDIAIAPVRFDHVAKPPKNQPIAIGLNTKDEGLSINTFPTMMNIQGPAKGRERPRNDILDLPDGERPYIAAEVELRLDYKEAPTTNILGAHDTTERDERVYSVRSKPGMSAMQVAQALTNKVNAGDDFRATLSEGPNGSANIAFERL